MRLPATSRDGVLNSARPKGNVVEFEGEFFPPDDDPAEVDQEYHGELRRVNLGPAVIARRLETETDPEERRALETAKTAWAKMGGYAGARTRAGEPYRGEKRPDVRARSMSELASKVKPVAHAFVLGELRAPGASEGVIDFESLVSDQESGNK